MLQVYLQFMASVHSNKNSPFWTASVRVWIVQDDHPHGGFWQRSRRSTRIPLTEPKSKALAVAQQIEQLSNDAQKTGDAIGFFERATERILAAAGHALPHRTTTWKDWSNKWLHERPLSPRTYKQYQNFLKKFTIFLKEKAGQPLRLITFEDCQNFYRDIIKSGGTINTANQTLKLIKSCLDRAVLHEHLKKNPVALLRFETVEESNREPFSAEEIKIILSHIDAHENPEWRTAVLFALFYGLRLRDALSRRFEEIKEADGIRFLEFVPAKKARAGKAVKLPLIDPLASMQGKGWITPTLEKISHPSQSFSLILERAGIAITRAEKIGIGNPKANKSFHSLRHTCNTWLANAGVDIRVRQLISDHESATINHRYTHPDIAIMQAAVEKISQKI